MDSDGKYYASVLFEYEADITMVCMMSTNAIGLDYKSDGLYMDSNSKSAGMHKYYRESHRKLAKAQRRLSRKEGARKGETRSNNYIKQQKTTSQTRRRIRTLQILVLAI